MGRVGAVWVRTRVRPRASRKAPKIIKNCFWLILEGQIHVFPTFFDGRPYGFERSFGALGGSKGRPGGALGAPEFALGGLGGVPRERAPRLEAQMRGLGTDFGDPKESAHAQNTHIYYVF